MGGHRKQARRGGGDPPLCSKAEFRQLHMERGRLRAEVRLRAARSLTH
jgi:hypothetical protein